MRVVDLCEWSALARRLERVNSERHDELLRALREIVEAEETLARVARRSDRRLA
jgi:hypothetical protein